MLLWGLLALLLYRWPETGPFAGVVERLAIGCVVLSTSYLVGIALVEGVNEDMSQVRQRERRYCAIALASTATVLFAGWSADAEGLPLDLGIGWQGFLLILSISVPIAVNTVLFAIRGIRELWIGSHEGVEKLAGLVLFVVNLFAWTNQLLMMSQIVFGRPDLGPHLPRVEWIFTICIAANGALLALPLAASLGEAAGLDAAGRSCRRLRVLWRDLTEAVPEIVMPPGVGTGSRGRLFRMTVEIRDAILHLGPYLPPVHGEDPSGGPGELDRFAHRLALATAARKAGVQPENPTGARLSGLPAGDFDADLRQLRELARAWRRMRSSGVSIDESARPTLSPPPGTGPAGLKQTMPWGS
ncbi:MAB_1171c family putative transporter [Nocardia bhagyanarayanae]|uniref:MAB_1171c family putative transporter n=1 Tax=Nocardia bhagyanarayanae TaxID=1215925 RepID=UPI0011527D97|nr:MAB_1171c family putative transporter [Nocardia bhagyanarayanae]